MSYAENHMCGIGSGEIAAIAGLNPWRSRLQVWEDKICHGSNREERDTFATRRGIAMESLLVKELSLVTGIEFKQQPQEDKDLHTPWYSSRRDGLVILASPDAVANTEDGLVCGEVKAPGINTHPHWGDSGSGANGVPPYVIAQVHWQMEASGARMTYVGAAIGNEFRVYVVDYNPELAGKLCAIGKEFWRCVETGEEPITDGSKAATRWLGEKHPYDDKTTIRTDNDPGLNDLIEKVLIPAIRTRKEAEKMEEIAKNRVKQAMGKAARAEGPWGKVTWIKSKDKVAMDWEGLALEALDLIPFDGRLRAELKDKHLFVREGPRRFTIYPNNNHT